MKNRYILSILSVVAASAIWYVNSDQTKYYTPRTHEAKTTATAIEGYAEYIQSVKANPETGIISDKDLNTALTQLSASQKKHAKVDFPLQWQFVGPDNIGGRTRALLIDKDDNQVLYTGGVSGGLFKSTNGGGTWRAVDDDLDFFGVSALTQTAAGTILYGTGEGAFNRVQEGNENSAFRGGGMFKSTDDGETFALVNSTRSMTSIYDMIVLPNGKDILCGASNGLFHSNDEGETWSNLLFSAVKDIAMDKNGNVLIYTGNDVMRSTNPTDGNSYTDVSAASFPASVKRIALAFAHDDPNYAYAIVAANNINIGGTAYSNAMQGIYQSVDNGVSWTKIVGSASTNFAPLTNLGAGGQGDYDLCIGVDPNDKERIFIGGVRLATWTKGSGVEYVGNNFDSPFNPLGVHADKHNFVFDTKSDPAIMYIVSDGGVAKTTNEALNRFATINNGLATTQFFGIDANVNGVVMGGTQDNSNIVVDGLGSTDEAGITVWSGDGFQTAFSRINPSLVFGESQEGGLFRSFTLGSAPAQFFDNRIESDFTSATQENNIFNTPMELWEDEDSLESKLFYAMSNSIWAAIDPHDIDKRTRWFKVGDISGAAIITATPDGNHVFAGNRNGVIIRMDNIQGANYDTTEIVVYGDISDSISQVRIDNGIPGRVITSIAVDNTNPDRVVVTTGGYGNSSNVYISENALSASPSFRAIGSFATNSLPQMPVYAAVINENNPDQIIIGTEFGIWATENGSATNPTWSVQNSGTNADQNFPRVPVFHIAQVSVFNESGPTLYAGTHGRGMWKSASLLTSIKEVNKEQGNASMIKVYPMPAQDVVTVEALEARDHISGLEIFNLNGELVATSAESTINVSTIANGMYIIKATTESTVYAKRLMIQH